LLIKIGFDISNCNYLRQCTISTAVSGMTYLFYFIASYLPIVRNTDTCVTFFPFIQTGFDMDDVVRKYIRYTLNEKQFNPDVVVDLIHLRKASMLEDAEVAEILNEISRRIVREKGILFF
jgi:hypothetical protein